MVKADCYTSFMFQKSTLEAHMKISKIMTSNPATILQDASLRTALEMMESKKCHHLPVVNSHGTLMGVLSSHDCRQALNIPSTIRSQWQTNKLLDRLPVSAIMTMIPTVVQEDTAAETGVDLMLDKHIGCLPVMRKKSLVGIVTSSDILRYFKAMLSQSPDLSREQTLVKTS
jgi:acetoin utilization protein AcuB